MYADEEEPFDLNEWRPPKDTLDFNDFGPPWQRPRAVRRDEEPPRSLWLLPLVQVAITCALTLLGIVLGAWAGALAMLPKEPLKGGSGTGIGVMIMVGGPAGAVLGGALGLAAGVAVALMLRPTHRG
jgi:hypothetical protein